MRSSWLFGRTKEFWSGWGKEDTVNAAGRCGSGEILGPGEEEEAGLYLKFLSARTLTGSMGNFYVWHFGFRYT